MKIKFTDVLFLSKKGLLKNIMRTFIFLFFVTAFSFTPKNIFSQNVKIVFKTDKSLTIDQVFDIIMINTDYTFVYKSDLFSTTPKINIKKGTIKVNNLLKKSLSVGNFIYELSKGGAIFIKKNPDKKEEITDIKQGRTITGTIMDVNGMSLPGANVLVKGVTVGSQTDLDGNFSMVIPEGVQYPRNIIYGL